MNTLITLARHGQTDWNVAGRYQGHAPIPLNDTGHTQAQYLAEALTQDDGLTAIYCSDLFRCRQTARPTAMKLDLDVRCDVRLREIDVGFWQGLTRDEHAAFDQENSAIFRADPLHVPMPGGESLQMLADRMVAAFVDILDAHRDDHVLIVSHGGAIRALVRHFGLWQDGMRIANTSLTQLRVSANGDGAELTQPVNISHLPPELVT